MVWCRCRCRWYPFTGDFKLFFWSKCSVLQFVSTSVRLSVYLSISLSCIHTHTHTHTHIHTCIHKLYCWYQKCHITFPPKPDQTPGNNSCQTTESCQHKKQKQTQTNITKLQTEPNEWMSRNICNSFIGTPCERGEQINCTSGLKMAPRVICRSKYFAEYLLTWTN